MVRTHNFVKVPSGLDTLYIDVTFTFFPLYETRHETVKVVVAISNRLNVQPTSTFCESILFTRFLN